MSKNKHKIFYETLCFDSNAINCVSVATEVLCLTVGLLVLLVVGGPYLYFHRDIQW